MFKALKPTLAASIIAATFSFNTFAADVEKIHFLILAALVAVGI